MMMTHNKVDHLGVDGRARKTQARHHHRVSWTCFWFGEGDGPFKAERRCCFVRLRVSPGMHGRGLWTTSLLLTRRRSGGRSGALSLGM